VLLNCLFSSISNTKKIIQTVGIAVAISAGFVAGASADFKVVGYFPTWQGSVDNIAYDKVTHINYSFLIPNSNGTLKNLEGGQQRLIDLVERAHNSDVKVLIAVGGWNNGDDSAFRDLSSNNTTRNAFVSNIINFVNQYNLDGVDIDWEYPDAGSEANNFKLLMQQLSNELHSRGKLLTAAVTSNDSPGSVDASVIDSVDFLNVMAYDMGNPHSTYEGAQGAINHWIYNEGLPRDKTVLGVPFYSHINWVAYKDVIATYGSGAAYQDNAGGLDYNGIPTIKAKSELSLAQAGGIMFWEISQDTHDETSLMTTIWDVVGSTVEGGGDPDPGSNYPDWQSGQNYNIGDVVHYNGKHYITVHDNPGYNPVVSHWFWDEFTVVDPNPNPQPNYPQWQYGQFYTVGEIVKYNDKHYIAVHDNPGYDPVISHWYWDEYVGDGENPGPDPEPNPESGPYLGSPINVPGVLEAEYYDLGAFADSDTSNLGGALRTDAVDIEQSTEHGQNIGWIDAGEWVEYSISVQESGDYKASALVASESGGGQFQISINGQSLASFSVPSTGNWQNWAWVDQYITLTQGEHILRVSMQQGGFNFNAIDFTLSDGGGNPNQCRGTGWRAANLTNFESYPDPDSEECVKYNGCQWAGQFAGVDGVMPESWVASHNIAAVHSDYFSQYNGKTLQLRQGNKEIDVVVYDMCADSDCSGCCTQNLGSEGFLIDIEKYTMQRFGSGSGSVEWQVCE